MPQPVNTRETFPVAGEAGSAGATGSGGSGWVAVSVATSPEVFSNNASGLPIRVRLSVMY